MKCRMLFKRCASLCSLLWRRASHIALSRGISKALRNIGLCLLAVSLLTLSPLYSSSANALSFSTSYSSGIKSNSYAYWAGEGFTQFVQRSDGGYFPTRASTLYRTDVCFTSNIQPNSLVSFTVTFPTSSVSTWSGFAPYDNYSLLSKSSYTAADYVNETYLLYTHLGADCVALSTPNPDSFVGTFSKSGVPLRFSGVSVAVLADSTTDYSSNLSALLEQLTNANTNLAIINKNITGLVSGVGGVQSSVNNAANQAHQDSQAQIDAINEQTQQEQNQYEQEKEEENQREDDLDGQASQAESMFSFTFLNPFIGIFELFNDSGCVSIPTIAGMVGSDNTTYCPWFDSSVRNILTPVFGFSSMILIFGFVIYWLRDGSSDILYKGGKR